LQIQNLKGADYKSAPTAKSAPTGVIYKKLFLFLHKYYALKNGKRCIKHDDSSRLYAPF
jgi:hypothetical protein